MGIRAIAPKEKLPPWFELGFGLGLVMGLGSNFSSGAIFLEPMDQKNSSKIKEICSYKKLSVEKVIYFDEGLYF